MADDTQADAEQAQPEEQSPLADKVRRAIQAHPVLRDQKKLVVTVKGRRVHLDGTVFTRFMHRQLVDLLMRIPGAEEIVFSVEPEIQAPQRRDLEGRVPGVSDGPAPSDPYFSTPRLRPKRD